MHKCCTHKHLPPGPVVFAWPVFPNEQLLLCWGGNCKISKALDENSLPTLSASQSRKLCVHYCFCVTLRSRRKLLSSLVFVTYRSCFRLYVEYVESVGGGKWGGQTNAFQSVAGFSFPPAVDEDRERDKKREGGISVCVCVWMEGQSGGWD